MEISKAPWRQRLRIPLLAIVGLNVVVFLAYTLPRSLRQRSVTSRLTALREEVERERVRADGLRRRSDTMRANAADVERFYRDLVSPRQQALLPILREIEDAAGQQGLETGRYTLKPETVKGAPLELTTITLPVTGTYRQLVAFLDELERSKYFVVVQRIDLHGQRQGDEIGLDVILAAYLRLEPEGPHAG